MVFQGEFLFINRITKRISIQYKVAKSMIAHNFEKLNTI